MECQECKKRPATLHFTQIINGQKTEIHVCEICAKEKGYVTYPEDGYSLHDLLTSLFNFDSTQLGQEAEPLKQVEELQCDKCKMTFADFRRIGKFGCAECYPAFSYKLEPILKRVHSGNTKHSGKIPKRKGGNLHTKKKIESYKLKLQQLIEDEAFEEAAVVRDTIKQLEQKQKNSEAGDHS